MADVFFDSAAGLALVMDNQAIYQNLLRSFIALHQNLVERIDRLIKQNDRPELVRFCHTAKSTTGHVGSSALQQQARAIELQLKSSAGFLTDAEKSALANLVQDMLRLMDLAADYLAEHGLTASRHAALNQQAEPGPSPGRSDPDQANDIQAWQQLRKSLDAHDPKSSRRLLGQLLDQTEQETDKQILLQVQLLLGQYHYAKACQLIDPILAQRKSDT